jgi:hypothetical protein
VKGKEEKGSRIKPLGGQVLQTFAKMENTEREVNWRSAMSWLIFVFVEFEVLVQHPSKDTC